jgi:hypothetical protein
MDGNMAADLVLLVHALWVIFMVGGIVFTFAAWFRKSLFEWARFRTAHLLGLLFTASMGIFGWNCPLTNLESALRSEGSKAAYPGSFLAYYLDKVVYWEITQSTITALTIVLALFVVVTYLVRPPSRVMELFGKGSTGAKRNHR